ncbi:Clp protease ClpP [Roseovarius sp. SCSIO 43702]|uniref:head maturation protease, ClpP-related n=1 Tax=Roseovarius sp. SCSIO 43702 TaxID=2823043 RepID=UPI001C735F41|nr:head maturation protease, ClpP-related [Roseovarius sp. SCSIO 43702]QYX58115.1 Clp protease ClpP [Roseovarius sp. SCSIO 43702]
MSLRDLPAGPDFQRPATYQFDTPSDALAKWADMPSPTTASDNTTIMMLDIIGDDGIGGGVSAKRIAAALRAIGNRDVTVQINSPGGDMFEGIAIYNLLRAHPAEVSIEVLGIAASAASIIAMAGDHIRMAPSSFLMLHNAWGVVIGNRHDMAEAATLFERFDGALADIYAARSGKTRAEIAALLDAETFLTAQEAVAAGLADIIAGETDAASDVSAQVRPDILAKRRIDAALAQQGIPRSERRMMLKQITGTRNAAEPATHDAGFDPAALRQLLDTLQA